MVLLQCLGIGAYHFLSKNCCTYLELKLDPWTLFLVTWTILQLHKIGFMFFELFRLAKKKRMNSILFDIVNRILKETQRRRTSSFSNSKWKHGYIFFCRRTHEQKKHGFTFLESMKVQKIRIQSFCKLQMLRHAQIQSVNAAKCFRKRQFHFLQTQTVNKCSFNKMFFPKNGCGLGGPTQAQSACPHFLEKTFH